MGTGAAANESIMGVVVADIYFLHERGSYVGAYFWCYFMGLFVGPIISGTIANDITWRWFFWVCTIAQGLNIVGLLVLFPETRYLSRKSGTPSSVPSQRDEKDLAAMRLESIPPEQGQLDASLGKERPSRRQFSLLQPLDRNALHDVVRHFLTPIRLFCMPIIFWASMSMGASANALLAVNLLQSQVLAAPPYNFNPAQVGYANFALVGGGAIGLLVAGPWSDWLSARSTRRNGGIREPEMRLPSLFPFIAAALVGLVAFGVGSQNKWPWPAVTIVGLGLAGVQVVAIPTIVITYAIDSYKPVTREIMVIMTVIKNTFGFGMTYYINDWAAADGFIPPMMLLMAMTVGLTLAGTIFFMLYGKTCRRWTRNSKIHHF
jgi:MFS family permease